MVPEPTRGGVVAIAVAVVLASQLLPGALAETSTWPEAEPNDTPTNATLVSPGTTITGEIARQDGNESGPTADADWYALTARKGQNVTVEFTAGNESERLLVFLASADQLRNVSDKDENMSAENATGLRGGLGDLTFAPSGSTVELRTTTERSGVYFVGVIGHSGEYSLVVETDTADTAPETTTAATEGSAAGGLSPGETTAEQAAGGTLETNGGDGSAVGGDETTDASGPGFGLVAALAALIAVALLAFRRR